MSNKFQRAYWFVNDTILFCGIKTNNGDNNPSVCLPFYLHLFGGNQIRTVLI
jgi:hypothetical protein